MLGSLGLGAHRSRVQDQEVGQRLRRKKKRKKSELSRLPRERTPSPDTREKDECLVTICRPDVAPQIQFQKRMRRQIQWLHDRHIAMLEPTLEDCPLPHFLYGPDAERAQKGLSLEERYLKRTRQFVGGSEAVATTKAIFESREASGASIARSRDDGGIVLGDEETGDGDGFGEFVDAIEGDLTEDMGPPDGFEGFAQERSRIRLLRGEFQTNYDMVYLYRNLYMCQSVPPWFFRKKSMGDGQCMCDETCDENCLNRAMKMECVCCHLGDSCSNDAFQRRRWARTQVRTAGSKGRGLFSLQRIRAGQFVMEYVGEILDMSQLRERKEKNQRHCYFFTLESGLTIDASLKGNEARFMNHSCDPNCQPQKWIVDGEPRIGLFAVKDIEVGQELTFDYSFENLTDLIQRCFCGAPNCRGVIASKNAQQLAAEIGAEAQQEESEEEPEVAVERLTKEDSRTFREQEEDARRILSSLDDAPGSCFLEVVPPRRRVPLDSIVTPPWRFLLHRNMRRGIQYRMRQVWDWESKIVSTSAAAAVPSAEVDMRHLSSRERRLMEREQRLLLKSAAGRGDDWEPTRDGMGGVGSSDEDDGEEFVDASGSPLRKKHRKKRRRSRDSESKGRKRRRHRHKKKRRKKRKRSEKLEPEGQPKKKRRKLS